MKSSKLQLLKKEKEVRINNLLSKCLVFWAFSDEQFNENKTELQEGEKYISIGHGGYMPKSKLQLFIDGQEEISKWYKLELKKSKLDESDILYELNNHECFYSCDVTDAFEVLKDRYTLEQVKAVYKKNFNKYTKNM